MTPRAPSSCLWCFERNGTDWNGMERNGMERNGTYQVPMRCYGDKPSWFRKVSPSGAVPVANIDGRVISESNVIMQVFGICAFSFVCVAESAAVVLCMKIGRKLFIIFVFWYRQQQCFAAEFVVRRVIGQTLPQVAV